MSKMTLDEKQNGCDKKVYTIGSKMGRKFEQKRKVTWVKKANLVKAYTVGFHYYSELQGIGQKESLL